ncbi:conserved Plasmodium protein, unknown function [Plasmodium sp. gorilla clade G2]|uniref:conserved Plasmodium protein, unknown function n=1 Tax=Plasmodium sp. gorilla clade G2 TaxID=880535 RepID=UPI000D207BE2|nr:conserved Plasmodium protein, unknown function [Plasmodium sp. gorilla clade G2]SOV15115.1 conserved Plasmodium protein, unknown function [Plasmodium sp. gorilla clade G2]
MSDNKCEENGDFSLISVNYKACENLFNSIRKKQCVDVPVHGKALDDDYDKNKLQNKTKKNVSFEEKLYNDIEKKKEKFDDLSSHKSDHINISMIDKKRTDTLIRRKRSFVFNDYKYNEFMNAFKQQELKNFKNFHYLYKWKIAVAILLILSITFFLIGSYIYYESLNVIEININYNTGDDYKIINIPKDMKKPVYVYYKISNFYINFKTFLADESHSLVNEKKCSYIRTYADIYKYRCINNIQTLPEVYDDMNIDKNPKRKKKNQKCHISDLKPEEASKKIFPCGLVSAAIFNDKISLSKSSVSYDIDKFPILHYFDFLTYMKKHKQFTNYKIWINTFSPEYKNWFHSPMTSSFIKPYGVINEDLEAGEDYKLTFIQNSWPAEEWNAKKSFQLVSLRSIGNSSFKLAYAFFLLSLLYFIMIIFILVLVKCKYYKLGKTLSYCKMSMNKNIEKMNSRKKTNIQNINKKINSMQLEIMQNASSDPNNLSGADHSQQLCFCPLH